MNQLRKLVDELKQKLESAVILLATENNNKVQFISGVTNDLINKGFHAGHLIKGAAQRCGGGGGGRPDMAQAGGKEIKQIDHSLDYAKEYVLSIIKK